MKKPLTIKEQLLHLRKQKGVVISTENMSYIEYIKFLKYYNYINVISPFKDKFHNGKCASCNKHIYPNPTNLNEYVKLYNDERYEYAKILLVCLDFEKKLSSLTSYYFLLSLGQDYERELDCILGKSEYEFLAEEYKNYDSNIYVALDRLSFSKTIKLFKILDVSVQSQIYNDIKHEYSLNCNNILDLFISNMDILRQIRNVISHNNSLTIFINYFYDKRRSRIVRRNPKGRNGHIKIKNMIRYIKGCNI